MTNTPIDLQLRSVVDTIRFIARSGKATAKETAEIEACQLLDRPHRGLDNLKPGHVIYFDEATDEYARTSRLQTWAILHAIIDGIEIGTRHDFRTLTVATVLRCELKDEGWAQNDCTDISSCDFFVPVNDYGGWDADEIFGTIKDVELDAGGVPSAILCAKTGVTTMVLTEQDGIPSYVPVN